MNIFFWFLQRERAMVELNQKREILPELAVALWYSVGTMASLLQEIVRVYPLLLPDTLTPLASQRACDALLLMQSVASHPDTRSLLLNGMCVEMFVAVKLGNSLFNLVQLLSCSHCTFNYTWFAAHIPLYLYPFLNTATKTAPFQKLRFTSLGVIGALVKVG